jgi:hypothetical protein
MILESSECLLNTTAPNNVMLYLINTTCVRGSDLALLSFSGHIALLPNSEGDVVFCLQRVFKEESFGPCSDIIASMQITITVFPVIRFPPDENDLVIDIDPSAGIGAPLPAPPPPFLFAQLQKPPSSPFPSPLPSGSSSDGSSY